MTRAYSIDLRERVVSAVLSGGKTRDVAQRFGVAPSSVVKWSQLFRKTGSLKPGKMGGHRPFILDPHRAFILEQIEQLPHVTIDRLRELLAARGVFVCRNTVWRFVRRQGFSFKKKPL